MPKSAFVELFRWYEFEDAIVLFSDPELKAEIERLCAELGLLSSMPGVVTSMAGRTSLRLNAPHRVTPIQREYNDAADGLSRLRQRRLQAFKRKLTAGEIFASAKTRITDEKRIYVRSDAWRDLRLTQSGQAVALDKSERLYSLRFRNIDPFLFGNVETKLAEETIEGLKPMERAMLCALKLYPNGRIEPTLKATQIRIMVEMKKAGLKPVSENTITTALEKLGFYQPKPHLKKP